MPNETTYDHDAAYHEHISDMVDVLAMLCRQHQLPLFILIQTAHDENDHYRGIHLDYGLPVGRTFRAVRQAFEGSTQNSPDLAGTSEDGSEDPMEGVSVV